MNMSWQEPVAQRRPFELGYATDERSVFNFFNTVYAWMCAGLGVTATVAYLVSLNAAMVRALNQRGIAVAFLVGSVLIVWGIRAAARKISPAAATVLFLLYAALIGAILSGIFVVYSTATLGGAFLVTAGTFGATSAYGYITKRDLTSLGSFLFMGLVGLFLATLVNIFWANSILYWAITYLGLALFIVLTAYDSQKLKQIAYATQGDPRMAARYAVIGSLELYLDFLNMFLFILRIMGSRR
jgi:FtsH-binding integral membrane protein